MTTQSRSLRLADQLSSNPYTWPGSYPLYAITHDGAALCHECCKAERSSIGTTTGSDGWGVVHLEANWEDPSLFCDHCGSRIESAYAEPTANDARLDFVHDLQITQAEVSTILYYIESYFQGSDEIPEEDADLMSICRKLENLSLPKEANS